jgi:hypothetical protein
VSASPDPVTRVTRLAANIAAASVMAFALLWLLTTQVKDVRAQSPFADDPWDAFATYAAIFLPFVAGPTWIRSLRHRGPVLPAPTARRIITLAAALAALALVARATRVASISADADISADAFEPDLVDDLLVLATDVARPFGLRRPVHGAADAIERFLDGSTISPRRHRLLFGIALALAAGIAFDAWHAIREGPWAAPGVALIFGVLVASGVLAAYLGTLGPLRILRPPTR